MAEAMTPPNLNQLLLYTLGLSLRVINKFRRSIIGYTTPRSFSTKDITRAVIYCLEVVENWRKALTSYNIGDHPFRDKAILELGPGSDLGTGIVILALGAKSYTAVDINCLIHKTPPCFYSMLLSYLKKLPGYSNAEIVVNDFLNGKFSERFSYIYTPCFDLQKISSKEFDLLVSQAVLEHIVDTREMFQVLYPRLRPNAVMIHEVDLGTHTGLIRSLDPLNHLRYSDTLWNLLRFDGSPNRLRMDDYERILCELEFEKIEAKQITVLDEMYVNRSKPYLSSKFRKYSDCDIKTRSFYLMATKKRGK